MKSHKITKFQINGTSITCTFEEGSVVVFDFINVFKKNNGPMIEPLKKNSYFKKVFLESGALTWPNGFDICPNLIFQEGNHLSSAKRVNR